MDKLKLTLTESQLNAINSIWAYIPFMDTVLPDNRLLVSISSHLASKLLKRQLALQFSNKATTTITLEYYKVYFLEKLILTIMPSMANAAEQQDLKLLVGVLNQKLA